MVAPVLRNALLRSYLPECFPTGICWPEMTFYFIFLMLSLVDWLLITSELYSWNDAPWRAFDNFQTIDWSQSVPSINVSIKLIQCEGDSASLHAYTGLLLSSELLSISGALPPDWTPIPDACSDWQFQINTINKLLVCNWKLRLF